MHTGRWPRGAGNSVMSPGVKKHFKPEETESVKEAFTLQSGKKINFCYFKPPRCDFFFFGYSNLGAQIP